MHATATTRDTSERSGERALLRTYLDDARRHPLLTAEQERARLCELGELRRERWRAIVADLRQLARLRGWLGDAPRLRRSSTRATRVDEVAAELDAVLGHADVSETRIARLIVADADGDIADTMSSWIDDLDGEGAALYVARIRELSDRLRDARNAFACSNLRLVVQLAGRYGHGMTLSDRVQEGNLGLLVAIERFDPAHGTRFSTYAAWWIRYAITRALMNRGRAVRIPAHLHTIHAKARRAEASLRARLGRAPTLGEIAAHVDLPIDKIADASEAMGLHAISLHDLDHDEDHMVHRDRGEILVSHDVDTAIDDRRNGAVARAALRLLDPIEQDILVHRFGLGGAPTTTLRSLGERHALSRERIRQLQNRALDKLRIAIETSPTPAIASA